MTTRPLSVPAIRRRKVRDGVEPLVMVTAYDSPAGRVITQGGADLVLVGDSLAMVVLGYDNTLQLTIPDMAHHTGAVARGIASAAPSDGRHRPILVTDMPWLSFHTTTVAAVENAAQLIRAGASAVKLEGGHNRLPMIEALLAAEIPVMGHIGLMPQAVHVMGGFRVQGREEDAVRALIDDARALEAAGCFAIVLEGIPAGAAQLVTDAVDVPTIGIGAGPQCDGQVLVFHDVLGIEERMQPKFVRRFAALSAEGLRGVEAYAAAVRDGSFPSEAESYR